MRLFATMARFARGRPFGLWAGLLWMLLATGCMAQRPASSARLPRDLPADWAADVTSGGLPVTSGLIALLGRQPPLLSLVEEAMKNNPNLRATALRLQAAGYLLKVPRARRWPQLSAGGAAGRGNQEMVAASGAPVTADAYRLSLGVEWELDIWGRLADERAAAEQAVQAQAHEYRQIRDALAARVIQAWIEQVAIRRSMAIERERIAALQCLERVLAKRYQGGLGTPDALSEASARSEIARADLSVRREALQRAIRKLELLLGRYPRGGLISAGELPAVAQPSADIPAHVVLRRPDVRQALAQVESAASLSRAADKAFLPELRLSGQVFRQATQLSSLGGAASCWSLAGALFQPLFDGGRLAAMAGARRVEVEAALMELQEVVLRALKEVEDAFGLEHELAMQSRALAIAARQSARSRRYYEERYRQGLDPLQSLLLAREQEMAVRIRQNEVTAERLANRVDLALALGAAWNDEQTLFARERQP